MPPAAIDEAKRVVGDMLQSHLPNGWGFRVQLSPRAGQSAADHLTPNDLGWLIWRPEDIGDRSRYYRLELVGTSGHEFVITHGNVDQGTTSRPETATVFTTWTADLVFASIAKGEGSYEPNRYGRS